MTNHQTYIAPGATLTIRIADKEMVSSPSRGGHITGLDITQRHLIEIRQGDNTKVSFWLNFQDYQKDDTINADVGLRYYQGYGTFSILQASDNRCHCPVK